ncbi:MAG: hypothetical protein H6594_10130 [Flavobacteriales bacterium]|nr:hypothetical protein [Flavobacteriales bacterium]
MDPTLTTAPGTQLSPEDAGSLVRTARWARFLAIIGFVVIGLMVVMGFSMGSLFAMLGNMQARMTDMDAFPVLPMRALGAVYTVLFLLIGAVYFVPTLLLYQFATRTLRSLAGPFDPGTFSGALAAQRRLYKFIGILLIIVLAFYLVAILFMLLAGGMAAMMSAGSGMS